MGKCKCYHVQKQIKYSNYGTTSSTIYQGVCWGTKECEQCFCRGEEIKCDFYPYIRERAEKERFEYKIKEAKTLLEKNGYEVKKI